MNNMMKYYENRYVKILRTYILSAVQYAEVQEASTGLKLIVKLNELTDEKVEELQQEVKVEVEAESDVEIKAIDNEVVESKEAVEEVIFAVNNKNGKEFKLGTLESIETSSVFKKHSFDKEAVSRVLEGVQKSHKGFSFISK